jgi:hypothetical protein
MSLLRCILRAMKRTLTSSIRTVAPLLLATSLLLLAHVPSALAQSEDLVSADRPGIADSSTTVKRGAFQIEIGVERDSESGQHTFSTPTLLRYGLSDAFELRVETSGYERVSGGGDHASGLAPVSAGAKWNFLSATKDRPSLGLIGRVFVPSGSGEFKSHDATGDLRLAADMSFGEKWAINPNIGVSFDHDERSFTAALAALTVQYNLTEKGNVFVDGGYESRSGSGHGSGSSLLLDTGVAWIVGRDTQLDFSIGWGAHGSDVPNVFISAGYTRRF